MSAVSISGDPLHPGRIKPRPNQKTVQGLCAGGGQIPCRINFQGDRIITNMARYGDLVGRQRRYLRQQRGQIIQNRPGSRAVSGKEWTVFGFKEFNHQPLVRKAGHDMTQQPIGHHAFATIRGKAAFDFAQDRFFGRSFG